MENEGWRESIVAGVPSLTTITRHREKECRRCLSINVADERCIRSEEFRDSLARVEERIRFEENMKGTSCVYFDTMLRNVRLATAAWSMIGMTLRRCVFFFEKSIEQRNLLKLRNRLSHRVFGATRIYFTFAASFMYLLSNGARIHRRGERIAARRWISVSTVINIARGNEIETISSPLSREGHA